MRGGVTPLPIVYAEGAPAPSEAPRGRAGRAMLISTDLTRPVVVPEVTSGDGVAGATADGDAGCAASAGVAAREAADEGMLSEADVMMGASAAGDDDPVFDKDMAGEQDVVGEDAVVAEDTVVGDVGADHDVIIVADAGDAAAVFGTDVDGAVFAEAVGVTDDDAAIAIAVFEVLGDGADDAVGEEDVGFAGGGVAFDLGVVVHDAVWAEGDVFADEGEGADLDIVSEPGAIFDDRHRMNIRHVAPGRERERVSRVL